MSRIITSEKCAFSTPLGTVINGMLAGSLGILAMDALLYARYVRVRGTKSFLQWETAAGLDSWENAPAPAQVGKRIFEGLMQHPLGPDRVRLTTNLVHWGYGTIWGVIYSIAAGSGHKRRLSYGLPFGLLVWATGYALLPPTGIYKQIWDYDFSTLWKDASAHLVYGLVTATTFKFLSKTFSS